MNKKPRPHRHLIIDALVQSAPTSEEQMRELMVYIVKSIDMQVAVLSKVPLKLFGVKIPFLKVEQRNPIAWYCKDQGNEGMTAGVILTTSHLVVHFWDNCNPNTMHFDLYSCSDFNPKKIIELLNAKFGILEADGEFMDRNGESDDYDLEITKTSTGKMQFKKSIRKAKKNFKLQA